MDAQNSRLDAAWNLRGALFMILAMGCFAVEDSFMKLAARELPVGQVLFTFGVFGVLVFSTLARRAKEPPYSRQMLGRAMLLRSVFEITGRLFFMLAIALTPLSTASAILQATPLVVISGAALFFHEKTGMARWLAVGTGFIGVLMILRPGSEGFGLLSLLAVIATLGFAGRDLATRAAPRGLSHRQLGVLGFTMLVISGLIALPFGPPPVWPSALALAKLLAGSCAGLIAYNALTIAMRTGEIGAVTPFRYTRLVFAMIAGFLLFGERPDQWTILGSLVVVASGIAALTQRNKAAG
ncbi:DMT family transporter [Paracoccus aminophilus]|uniref:S-adenosylmethionine uptake transporter n=1 Tax=Paracoccus aminophilus JCM 7686 TaxID=1367847 RepID=S5XMU1_PARAH|nr:DMT family transporter [Paracoccus aminophilus]AGT08579.1 S-adenosylmethionine uptake transporter [Paracoccus aminophilus JCM 7686]